VAEVLEDESAFIFSVNKFKVYQKTQHNTPEKLIFINQSLINGNTVLKVRCVLDRIHSIERSKYRRNAMVYLHN
jgi:hypothetical protein